MISGLSHQSRDDLAPTEEASDLGAPTASATRARSGRSLPHVTRVDARAWIWVGAVIVVLGFVLIAVGWGQVASETQVHLQLPYVASATAVGLGFILVGLTVINIATRRRDRAEQDQRVMQLVAIMEELRDAMDTGDRG